MTTTKKKISNSPEQSRLPKKEIEAWYDLTTGTFWVRNAQGTWIRFNTDSMRRHLNVCGLRRTSVNGTPSAIEVKIHDIQMTKGVSYAGPLAGYRAGMHVIGNAQILVTRSPYIIQPQEGDCSMILEVLHGLFGPIQTQVLLAWCKISHECIRSGIKRQGQALVLAGPKNSGKSFIQNHILTPLLGGRTAKPYQYMTGGTPFNADLFEAEHLMVEDEVASTDIRSRRNFGVNIKQVVANTVQRMHRKHCDALSLEPFWRLTISCNDNIEDLMVLPPLDDSISDKLILLRAGQFTMPMPTVTSEERSAFARRIEAELPMFVAHLNRWQIPGDLLGRRFGIDTYHDKQLVEAIDELAPESRLLRMIDQYITYGVSPREMTAEEIERILREKDRAACDRILTFANACGNYLGRLATKHPDRVKRHRTNSDRRWILLPPPTTTPDNSARPPLREETTARLDDTSMEVVTV